ncbi:MAG: hypothetical protein JSW11_13010 [Candidatus Heimdallarchaeota archaeon]|nr:MAG: hypothetical protein JSW11_13010 [Candidatus Heimdallarchaeota archaeon]
MPSPFCTECGTLIVSKRKGPKQQIFFVCPNCQKEVEIEDTTIFQESTPIEHTPRDHTRILEDEPPPIPKIFTQTYDERRKKKCHHPNAVFQGFYQFSSGDEASRKYWYCPDCGQVFRFSGKVKVKPRRRIISRENNVGSKKK